MNPNIHSDFIALKDVSLSGDMILYPCRHIFSHEKAIRHFGKMIQGACSKSRACPICFKQITAYFPDSSRSEVVMHAGNTSKSIFNSPSRQDLGAIDDTIKEDEEMAKALYLSLNGSFMPHFNLSEDEEMAKAIALSLK